MILYFTKNETAVILRLIKSNQSQKSNLLQLIIIYILSPVEIIHCKKISQGLPPLIFVGAKFK